MRAVNLREARPDDSWLLWTWRNAPDIRATAFSPDPIPWEHHERWFAGKLADPRCLIFIAEDNEPLGQVRFDLDERGSQAEISVSVQRGQRGRGLGSLMIKQGVEAASMAAPALETVHAYIKPGNEASVRAFGRAGFASVGLREVRDAEALHYVWHRTAAFATAAGE